MNKFMEENPEMFEIAGSKFYLDIDQLSQTIRVERNQTIDDLLSESKEEESNSENNMGPEDTQIIDITKWEVLKVMIETILTYNESVDEAMGFSKLENQLSIPFKLSFNTLLNYKIIKEKNGR